MTSDSLPGQATASPAPAPTADKGREGALTLARYWPAAAFAASLLLALLGQWLVAGRAHAAWGVAAFAAASALFLAPLWRHRLWPAVELPEVGAPDRLLIHSRSWRLIFAANALLLAWLAYGGFAGNHLDGGFWFWLGAIFYLVLAVGARPAAGWRRRWRQGLRRERWLLLALASVTLVAIFFRVYRLADVPAEMTSDHAEKLLDVNDLLNGLRPLFFPRNTGREMMQFYLTAALIKFTPLTLGHLALKVGTALVGIVTVPFAYLLGKELYGRWVGLLAAFFLAVSHWHVAITRVGLRFPFTAAFAVPALYFLLRALKHNRRNDWLAAGFVLGLGLHTYTAMRIVPLLFLVLVALKVAWDALAARRGHGATEEASGLQRAFWVDALLGGLMSLLLFLPLLRYMVEEPQMFWMRAASRAQEALAPAAMWRTFWDNVKNALLMFNYRGDVVPANTIPGEPALGLVSGGLFILGVVYLFYRLLRWRERRAAYLLVSFFILLLPSILSLAYPQENPSVVRTGGAVPLVMVMAALPLVAMGLRLRQVPAPSRTLGGLLTVTLAGLLLLALGDNYQWYFVRYDAHYLQSSWNASEMGQVVRAFVAQGGRMEDVYHVPFPHWVDTRNIAINAGDIGWRNAVVDREEIPAHAADPHAKLYLVYPADRPALDLLHEVYPRGWEEVYDSPRPGKDFIIFHVPAARP